MAFSRNWLKSLGLTDEQVGAVIEEHTGVTDALKEQRDKAKQEAEGYKKEADKLPAVQQELDSLKGGEDYKAKFEQEHQAFEDFKAQIAQQEQTNKVMAAYRKLLTDERIKEDRMDMIIRHTDFTDMKLDKDGNLENVETLRKTIGDDWGVFRVTTKETKQKVANPPETGTTGSGMSRAKELAQKFAQDRYGVKPDTGKE